MFIYDKRKPESSCKSLQNSITHYRQLVFFTFKYFSLLHLSPPLLWQPRCTGLPKCCKEINLTFMIRNFCSGFPPTPPPPYFVSLNPWSWYPEDYSQSPIWCVQSGHLRSLQSHFIDVCMYSSLFTCVSHLILLVPGEQKFSCA